MSATEKQKAANDSGEAFGHITALAIVRTRNYTRQALRCLTKGQYNAAAEYLDLAQNDLMKYHEEREAHEA